MRGQERTVFSSRSRNRYFTSRQIIDVHNRSNTRAGNPLHRTKAIGVSCNNADRRIDIVVAQSIRITSRASDILSIALPLVTDRAQTIEVAERIGHGQCFIFGGNSRNVHRTSRQVVDILNWPEVQTSNVFSCSLEVCIGCNETNRGSDICIAQRVLALCRTRNIYSVTLPLERNKTDPIRICYTGKARRNRLVFHRCPEYHSIANWEIIDILDSSCG